MKFIDVVLSVEEKRQLNKLLPISEEQQRLIDQIAFLMLEITTNNE